MNPTMDEVVGLDDVKMALRGCFQGQYPPLQTFLFYGPNGTGKTRLAHAAATELQASFESVISNDLIDGHPGQSAVLVRDLFQRARDSARGRAIIFLDHADIGFPRSVREGTDEHTIEALLELSEQLSVTEDIPGRQADILFLAASDQPWRMDSVLLSRFHVRSYFALPNVQARTDIIEMEMDGAANNLLRADFLTLGKKTSLYNGRQLDFLVSHAFDQAMIPSMNATQFMVDDNGVYTPCFVNCGHTMCGTQAHDAACAGCGARRTTWDDVPRGMLAIPEKTLGHFEAELSYPSDNVTDHFVPLDVEMRKAILMPLLKTVRHNLCFGDVEKIGDMTDKCTRRAVTSIFRKAVVWAMARTNRAQQFKQDASGLFIPCIKYPNCGHAECGTSPTCLGCGAKLMTVHQVPDGKLKPPLLSLRHFKLAFREKNYPLSAEDLDLTVFSTQAPLNEADYSSDEDVNM